MNQRLAPGLRVGKSRIDGKGCFAAACFHRHQRIAEYVGKRIALAEAERKRRVPGKKFVCDIDTDWSIDGSRGGNGTQYINHSCDPNSYTVILGGRLFLHALKHITRGEEITADYLYELELEKTQCHCKAISCVEKDRLAMM